MSNTVIKVENIGKQYRLGQVGTGTIATDVNRWWHKVRGKEDPYLKIGEVNDRSIKGVGDLVWALKDINFEVKQGEVLGIIGKNGAGKSTLLKILSQVTGPTVGDIKVKGRIASLLEVGTGFHPELSGRDNVFLNGAILGMSKREIKDKFDEIVYFSGVERYIDTPVKRYSSGMYVRLAFAVAAHLDPEILIVDEVLAVGDAEFQKKCMGKMKDVSREGRTVLFVSHNIPAIKNLCTSAILLEHGKVIFEGETSQSISKYLYNAQNITGMKKWDISSRPGNDNFKINSLSLKRLDKEISSTFNISEDFFAEIVFEVLNSGMQVGFSFILSDVEGYTLFGSLSNTDENIYGKKLEKGIYKSVVTIYGNLLNTGKFIVSLTGFSNHFSEGFNAENILTFEAIDDGVLKKDFNGGYGGVFRPELKWESFKIK